MINPKVLEKKLAKKTQQIIEDVVCEKCGKSIKYVLNTKHAHMPVHYVAVETIQVAVYCQDGTTHAGYPIHEHQNDMEVRI